MEYRALGPLTVVADGRNLRLGGPRQLTVLAVLLTRANHIVSQDALIEAVWAGAPPEAAKATMQSYIYGLRRELGAAAIARQGDGYRIQVDGSDFDVLAFEDLVTRGRRVLADEPSAASALLSEALGKWFGIPYGGLSDSPFLTGEVARLEELRLVAVEARIDADLQQGNHAAVIGELETLVREYPLRERFRAQHMLALYRSGRQAEALRSYQRTRSDLAEELGIEPSAELQDLEQRMLEHDPALVASTAASPAHDEWARTMRGHELRAPLGRGDFGVVYRAYQPSARREVAVKVIRPEYANDPNFVRRFERDAQAVADLEHPHLLRLMDHWRDPNGAYLVMPLMRGGSLAEALHRGAWNSAPALQLLEQVGGALGYAHRQGIVHRDVKPSNVLLDTEGNGYLGDFALAARSVDDAGWPISTAPAFLSPEELRGEVLTIRSDVYCLGVLAFQLFTGVIPSPGRPVPMLNEVRPDLRGDLAAVVARATAADPATRFERVEDFLRSVRQALGADVVALSGAGAPLTSREPIRTPYKGLRAFAEADAVDFHGRASLVDDLIQAVKTHNLVAVVGPSGSGKSSVVRAGLCPALRAGAIAGSRQWLITDMYPGSYPFEELEAALLRVAVDRPASLLAELLEPNGLLRAGKQILPGDDAGLLIVIDQFEELFSAVGSEATRRLFLDSLTAVSSDTRSRIRIVLTMRADFFDRPLEYPEFAAIFGDGLVTMGPPNREGLAQAIAAPARAVGVDLEPGLVARIVADVEHQPGGLPLLQYALTEMFTRREGDRLTIAGYEETGGVLGALGRRAEEIYSALSPAGQEAARQLFLRLVTVDEATADTRRRARHSELRALGIDEQLLESVIRGFGAFRLLSFDRDPVSRGPTVEVAHEALFREWDRLRTWIEDERESLLVARRLAMSTQEWLESGQDPSFLLRGSRLDQLSLWRERASVAVTADEASFIEASREQRRAEEQGEHRRRRRLVSALAVGLLVVGAFAVVAFVQRGIAIDEARNTWVRQLAGESIASVEVDPELALLIALEAVDVSKRAGDEPLPEALGAVERARRDMRLVGRVGGARSPLATNGSWMVTGVPDVTSSDLQVVDAQGRRTVTLAGPESASSAVIVAMHPSGTFVAAAYGTLVGNGYRPPSPDDPDVVVFDTRTGQEIRRHFIDVPVIGLDFSPDGTRLALSSSSQVEVWAWEADDVVATLAPDGGLGRASFVEDGGRLIVPLIGRGLGVFSVDDARQVDLIEVEDVDALAVIDPTHTRIAVPAGERLQVYDLRERRTVLDIPDSGLLSLAWSPDGSMLAYSGFDPIVYVVDLGSGHTTRLAGSRDNIFAMGFLDERRLANVAGGDILVWDVSPQGPPVLGRIPLDRPQWGYQLSPDQRLLAFNTSAGEGIFSTPTDSFNLIDAVSGRPIVSVPGELMLIDAGIRQVSPDFTLAGFLGRDHRSTVRRLPSLDVVAEFEPCRNPLTFTTDATWVLVTGWVCSNNVPEGATDVSEVVDVASSAVIATLPYRWIFSAQFNPPGDLEGGRYLAVTDQQVVEIYDLATGGSIGRLTRDEVDVGEAFLNLAFDPAGRYLVGGSVNGRVWAIELAAVVGGSTMKHAIVFDRLVHTGATAIPAVTTSGLIGSTGFDGTVNLWDIHSQELLAEFSADVGTPVVHFTSDGSQLIYPHAGTIVRYPVEPDELVAVAGALPTRDFTPEECRRYRAESACT